MSLDAETVTTPAAEAPAEAPSITLADIMGEAPSDEPSEAAEPAEAAEESPADETPAEKPPARVDPDALFTDEALATPEGVKAARAEVEARLRRWRQDYAKTKKLEDKIQRRRVEFKQERDAFEVTRRTVEGALSGLQRGGAKDVLHALGQLTNRDPIKLYEELSLYIAHNGKVPERKETPESKELAEIRAQLQAREEREEMARLEQEVTSHRQAIARGLANPEQFPLINAWVGDDVDQAVKMVDWIQEEIVEAHRRGRVLRAVDAAAMVETRLKQLAGRTTGAASPQQRAETQDPPAKKPVERTRNPAPSDDGFGLDDLRAAGLPI